MCFKRNPKVEPVLGGILFFSSVIIGDDGYLDYLLPILLLSHCVPETTAHPSQSCVLSYSLENEWGVAGGGIIRRAPWPSQSHVARHVRFSGLLRTKLKGQQLLS